MKICNTNSKAWRKWSLRSCHYERAWSLRVSIPWTTSWKRCWHMMLWIGVTDTQFSRSDIPSLAASLRIQTLNEEMLLSVLISLHLLVLIKRALIHAYHSLLPYWGPQRISSLCHSRRSNNIRHVLKIAFSKSNALFREKAPKSLRKDCLDIQTSMQCRYMNLAVENSKVVRKRVRKWNLVVRS